MELRRLLLIGRMVELVVAAKEGRRRGAGQLVDEDGSDSTIAGVRMQVVGCIGERGSPRSSRLKLCGREKRAPAVPWPIKRERPRRWQAFHRPHHRQNRRPARRRAAPPPATRMTMASPATIAFRGRGGVCGVLQVYKPSSCESGAQMEDVGGGAGGSLHRRRMWTAVRWRHGEVELLAVRWSWR